MRDARGKRTRTEEDIMEKETEVRKREEGSEVGQMKPKENSGENKGTRESERGNEGEQGSGREQGNGRETLTNA